MDLDAFKSINDRFGHAVGDRALRDVARAMRGAIRPYDSCVRYAGDEFVIVLSGCGAAEADIKRLELQRVLDELHFEVQAGTRRVARRQLRDGFVPSDGDTYEITARDRRPPHVPGQGRDGSPRTRPTRPSDDASGRPAAVC